MADIMGTCGAVAQRAERLSWLQRIFLELGRSVRRGRGTRRIDDQAWSAYMLRDVGLDEGRLGRGRDPRNLPLDWPLR